MTIHLPEDLERYVQMKIRSGRFASEDEAIGEAVRLLRQNEEAGAQPGEEESDVADASAVPAWKRVLDIMGKVPGEIFDRMPVDSSEQASCRCAAPEPMKIGRRRCKMAIVPGRG